MRPFLTVTAQSHESKQALTDENCVKSIHRRVTKSAIRRLIATQDSSGHRERSGRRELPLPQLLPMHKHRRACCATYLCKGMRKLTEQRMWTPSRRSVSLSASTLTKPSASAFVLARLFAAIGNLPTLYATPWKDHDS